MILSKLKTWALGAMAFAVMVLGVLASKRKADAEEAKKDLAETKAKSAEAQLNQLNRAQDAARNAGAASQEEVDNVENKVRRGDLGGMDNRF